MLWALVAGSFAFWGLRLLVSSYPTPSHAVGVVEAGAPRGDIARLLGPGAVAAPVAQAAANSRFQLSGVLAPKEGFTDAHGVALIAVDGRPARAYQVGARVADDWILQGVTRRTASIGPREAEAAAVLELPERPTPATGTLPAFNGGEMAGPGAAYSPNSYNSNSSPASNNSTPPPQPGPELQAPPMQVVPPPGPEIGAPPDTVPDGSGPQMGMGPPRRGAPSAR